MLKKIKLVYVILLLSILVVIGLCLKYNGTNIYNKNKDLPLSFIKMKDNEKYFIIKNKIDSSINSCNSVVLKNFSYLSYCEKLINNENTEPELNYKTDLIAHRVNAVYILKTKSAIKYINNELHYGIMKEYKLIYSFDSLGNILNSNASILWNKNGKTQEVNIDTNLNIKDKLINLVTIQNYELIKKNKIEAEEEQHLIAEEKAAKPQELIDKKTRVQELYNRYNIQSLITAPQLIYAYHDNEVAADDRYKGKNIAVTGIVDGIGKDNVDEIVVGLVGSDDDDVRCYFPNKVIAAQLHRGNKITLIGKCDGMIGRIATLENCVFVQ